MNKADYSAIALYNTSMLESSVAAITRDSANSMLTLQLRLRLEV